MIHFTFSSHFLSLVSHQKTNLRKHFLLESVTSSSYCYHSSYRPKMIVKRSEFIIGMTKYFLWVLENGVEATQGRGFIRSGDRNTRTASLVSYSVYTKLCDCFVWGGRAQWLWCENSLTYTYVLYLCRLEGLSVDSKLV